jgi:hypothetical protein
MLVYSFHVRVVSTNDQSTHAMINLNMIAKHIAASWCEVLCIEVPGVNYVYRH